MITFFQPNHIFVFGSNLAGRHGAGAALTAYLHFGAIHGTGVGPMGQCYAIPTKDQNLRTLSLEQIGRYVTDFLAFATNNPQLAFHVTPIGCGLAGYRPKEIAPLFREAPLNVVLPASFAAVLWPTPTTT